MVLEEVRPSSTCGDKVNSQISSREVRQQLALRKCYLLDMSTGKELASQWNSSYFALAFPFSVPRPISGPDFPRKPRERRNADAQCWNHSYSLAC